MEFSAFNGFALFWLQLQVYYGHLQQHLEQTMHQSSPYFGIN